MLRNKFLISVSRIFILLLFLFFFFAVNSKAQSINPNSSCTSSSCGSIRDISFPFRLRTDPLSCGYNSPSFVLDCQNNQAILNRRSKQYLVEEIDYLGFSIRLVDPSINRSNLSSCPVYSNVYDDWPSTVYTNYFDYNSPVTFIHCSTPLTDSKYVEAAFCGNKSSIFSNSSEIFSYVLAGERLTVSDLEDNCAVDKAVEISARRPVIDNSSLASIYDGLAYGFELSWFRALCGECDRSNGFCSLQGNTISCKHYCREDVPVSELNFKCRFKYWGIIAGAYGVIAVGGLIALRFLFGFPLLITLIVRKWRRRHLSMDESIEEFLQSQNNLTPINYTYSEIKKMTNNFDQKLGEGGYGTVYKGKLRSGPYVAVKVIDLQSTANEQEFISEVATIGRIHHYNIVQLIGFCVQNTKCALVYEFLPNGSLDRYIFGEHILGGMALKYEKMHEIALGVARGIDYLHRGCDMQILHFDIKPHNILLDDKFNPKISDFGLAKLYDPTNGNLVNAIITDARGTMGYMAPEMFYRNVGAISHKADVYSFGMLLMEMAGRRRNRNLSEDDDVDRIYFPCWVYDQICAGKEIEIVEASEEEKKMVKKIVIVALWCIQMNPRDRPSMNKVVEMLEVSDYEPRIPPKPFVAPLEIAEDHATYK